MKITSTIIAAVSSMLALSSCGEKPEPIPAPPKSPALTSTGMVCTYAPSQSAIVANLTSAAGGGVTAAAALAQALGLTVITHSSGALILTGGSGYIAGTIGAAAATGPVLIGAGVVVAGSAGVIELLCAPRNHPEMVAQVEAAASEFAARSKTTISNVATSTASFIVEQKITLIKSGAEAVSFANRGADQISAAIKR